ncbi:LysR family transcriptional regulator [Rhodoplanes sp. Z2-YC6860]|nr:LysR family transcriptional regulator [Rhodoplanes sp. Z2-YC6860]
MTEIETRLFRYFVGLAEEQHFGRAAMNLGISAPTLTQQIKKLEQQLGAKLVQRRGNTHVELTEAGLRVLDRARNVLREAKEAVAVARQAARGEVGRIEVGFMPSVVWSGLVQKFIGEFQHENPGIEIFLHMMNVEEQHTALVQEELDCGFVRSPLKFPPRIAGIDVFRQPMVLAMPQQHRLAAHASIDPAELTNEIFVNPPTVFELAFWDDTRAIAALGNFIPKVEKRTHDMIMSLAYVAAGYGIAIVAKSFEKIGIPNIVFRDFVPTAAPISTVAFAYRPNNSSPAVKMLVSFMRRFALEKSTSSKAAGLPEGRLGEL